MEKTIITFENGTKDKKCVIETGYDKIKGEMSIKFDFIPEVKPDPAKEPELYAIMAMSYIKILGENK